MIIYKTTNLVNGKIYIGQTNGQRKGYIGSGKLFNYALRKYGKHNFKKEIIIEGDFNRALIDSLEKHYIRLYNSSDKAIGYNIESGGYGGSGKKLTSEDKLKRSIILKEVYKSKELRLKVSKAVKESMTMERKLKIIKDLKNRKISEETRNKLKAAKYGFGSKGIIEVYKDEVLTNSFVSLEQCCKIMRFSLNTIRPILNKEVKHKEYLFKRAKAASKPKPKKK